MVLSKFKGRKNTTVRAPYISAHPGPLFARKSDGVMRRFPHLLAKNALAAS